MKSFNLFYVPKKMPQASVDYFNENEMKKNVCIIDDDKYFSFFLENLFARNKILTIGRMDHQKFQGFGLVALPDILLISFRQAKDVAFRSLEYAKQNYKGLKILVYTSSDDKCNFDSDFVSKISALVFVPDADKNQEQLLEAIHFILGDRK